MDDSMLQEIFSAKDPADKSALVAEYFFSEVSQEIALAARRCVILHWFNLAIVKALLQDTILTESEVYDVYEQLLTLPFIETVAWGRKFQDTTREGLLKRYTRDQPEILQAAAYLAAPVYEVDNNKNVVAEAFYCYIVAGDRHASRRLLSNLLEQVSSYEDWHYIDRLLRLQDEAEHIPFVQPTVLTEQDWILRGLLHCGQGKQAKAIVDYNHAIELNARSALAYNNRGTIYTQQHDYEKALLDYNHAIDLDPSNIQLYINRGIIYLRQYKYQEAEKDLDRAVQLDPFDKKIDRYYVQALIGLFHTNLANSLEADSYVYTKIFPLLQQMLAIQEKIFDPEYLELANIFSTLATHYSKLSRYDDAELFLKQALVIREKILGSEHIEVASNRTQLTDLHNLALDIKKQATGNDVVNKRKALHEISAGHFPEPAVVIDIRHSDDLRLLRYLMAELEGLATEMSFHTVPRWRYLTECIDFLKLTVPELDPIPNASSDFVVTTRTGKSMFIQGEEALINEIGRRCLDRVRNNRVAAVRDLNGASSYNNAIIRVIFLTDEESLKEAATYAAWLKEWYGSALPSDSTFVTRGNFIETVAVALHHHDNLFTNLETLTALDTILFMQTYSDDEGDQIYRAELLLYTLLLHWPESFEKNIDVLNEIQVPRQIHIAGISAIEYPARRVSRWFTYGLVAKSIEILRNPLKEQHEEIRHDVEHWLNDWWQRLQADMSAIMLSVIPDSQVLQTLQPLLHFSSFQKNTLSFLLENLEVFRKQVNEFYNNSTLEQALENILDVLTPLQKIDMQFTAKGDNTGSNIGEPYTKLMGLRLEAELFLTILFQNAPGAIPRAYAQLSALAKNIGIIQAAQQLPPDLEACHARFEQQAEQARQRLSSKLKQKRWWWSVRDKKALRRECENIYRELSHTVQEDFTKIHSFIVANVALELLRWADLYDPNGKTSPYQQRLKNLDQMLDTAQKYATREHEIAYQFLRPVTEKAEGEMWLTLNDRIELMPWDRITNTFAEFVDELSTGSVSLNLLAKSTLQYLGTERQLINEQIGQHEPDQTSDQDEEYFQSLSTILISTLISAQIRGFDLQADLPLLNQYIQSGKYYWQESSDFPSSISRLESLVRETVLKQATSTPPLPPTADLDSNIERILALWIELQLGDNASLMEVLKPRSIINRLKEDKIDSFDAIENLRQRTAIFGYSDEAIGDSHSYLFYSPSADSRDFFKTFNVIKTAQIHPIEFPDIEKLIYLYTHQIGVGVLSGANIP